MQIVNVLEAKTHFYEWFEAVIQGSQIIIAKQGNPVAVLRPYNQKKKVRFGILKGKIKISKNFDAPLPEDLSGPPMVGEE